MEILRKTSMQYIICNKRDTREHLQLSTKTQWDLLNIYKKTLWQTFVKIAVIKKYINLFNKYVRTRSNRPIGPPSFSSFWGSVAALQYTVQKHEVFQSRFTQHVVIVSDIEEGNIQKKEEKHKRKMFCNLIINLFQNQTGRFYDTPTNKMSCIHF